MIKKNKIKKNKRKIEIDQMISFINIITKGLMYFLGLAAVFITIFLILTYIHSFANVDVVNNLSSNLIINEMFLVVNSMESILIHTTNVNELCAIWVLISTTLFVTVEIWIIFLMVLNLNYIVNNMKKHNKLIMEDNIIYVNNLINWTIALILVKILSCIPKLLITCVISLYNLVFYFIIIILVCTIKYMLYESTNPKKKSNKNN